MSYYITYFEIAAFIASLLAWHVIHKSRYMRLFPLLLFVIVSVEVYLTFFHTPGRRVNAWIYNIQVPVQHLLYLAILYFATYHRKYKQLLIISMIVLVVFAMLSGFFLVEREQFNVYAYCMGSVFIIMGIIFKFYEMLQNPDEFNFLRKPFFYMLFAFLIFNVGTLPYFAMGNWLYTTKGYESYYQILINVMSILNYILYATYTIQFLWMVKKGSY